MHRLEKSCWNSMNHGKQTTKSSIKEAFNSSLITGSSIYLPTIGLVLFDFISSKVEVVDAVIPNKPAFTWTRSHFQPCEPATKDFWHRDCQYDYDIDDRWKSSWNPSITCESPTTERHGAYPGTHKRWDNEEEYNVRQGKKMVKWHWWYLWWQADTVKKRATYWCFQRIWSIEVDTDWIVWPWIFWSLILRPIMSWYWCRWRLLTTRINVEQDYRSRLFMNTLHLKSMQCS